MFQTVVYHGDNLLGEVEVYPQQTNNLNSNLDPNGSKVIAVLDHLMREKRIRVTKFSPPSDRCSPLAVLYTIAASGLCLKLESNIKSQSLEATTALCTLHSTCLRENKTAVVVLGEGELHLVAMPTRRNDGTPCFWGFAVMTGIYDSSLVMLNLRCLGIVFDLDETLVVANTMRSFEDRIDSLQRKVNIETDPQRIAGMLAEMKRYQDDKAILKQYAESDQVIDNEKVFKVQTELIPALSDNHQPIVRPLIRLQDKNIVLTRINPLVRDTSVLVRLRPAWEDLRAYLTARGRKRFEVYVCTMAERDYALEMWRLLDPDSNLINTKELLDRIVCVKSGSKKSLFNVFHDGSCHPKMALVVDDRLKVWDESDQSRVHVVPAFAPYYAPQAEANNAIPVLCMARNVACNVRGAFFKEFDDSLLQQISRILYEDDLKDFLSPPDVSNYLVSEDLTSLPNENREPICFDGMADAEVEKRLKEAISSSTIASAVASFCPNPDRNITTSLQFPAGASLCPDPNIASSLQFPVTGTRAPIPPPGPQGSIAPFSVNPFQPAAHTSRSLAHVGNAEISLQGSPAREEGEVPESELDPDTRARLLILQHGQDTSAEPPFSARPLAQPSIPGSGPVPVSVHGGVPGSSPSPPPPIQPGPRLQSRGSWFEDHVPPGQHGRAVAKDFFMNSEGAHFERQRPPPLPYSRKMDGFFRPDRLFVQKQRFPREGSRRDDRFRSNIPFQGEDVSTTRTSSSNRDLESGSGRAFSSNKDWDSDSGRSSSSHKDFESEAGQSISWSETPAGALRDIAKRCGVKVEYRSALAASAELKFVMEVSFAGAKIGEGTGKTRREAQNHAAEASLMSLADKYLAHRKSESSPARTDPGRTLGESDSATLGDLNSHGNHPPMHEDHLRFTKHGEAAGCDEDRESQDLTSDGSVRSASVSALEELCMAESLGLDFKLQPAPSTDSIEKDEVYAQVEVDGQILGRGSGLTWDDAKIQAAEKALTSLKSELGHPNQKRSASPRSFQGIPSKRMRPEFPRGTQRFPSRHPRNTSPVPLHNNNS